MGNPGERGEDSGWGEDEGMMWPHRPAFVDTRTVHRVSSRSDFSCMALLLFCLNSDLDMWGKDGRSEIMCPSSSTVSPLSLASVAKAAVPGTCSADRLPAWAVVRYPMPRRGGGGGRGLCSSQKQMLEHACDLLLPYPTAATDNSRFSSGPQNMTGDHGGDGDEEEAEARRLTSERLFIFTSMEEGTWRGEENNARGGQLYNDEEDNPGDNLAEEEAGGDADAPYEEEKEEGPFFSELVEMETRVEAGVIYESVLKTLLNLAVKILHMVLAKALGVAFTLAGPPLFLMAMWTMLSPAKNWDKAKTPVQKTRDPDDTLPKPKFKFRSKRRGALSANSSVDAAAENSLEAQAGHPLKSWDKLIEFQMLEMLTQSFDTMMADTLAARLNTENWDTLRQPISSAIARGAAKILEPKLTKDVSESLMKIVPPRLTESAVVVKLATRAISSSVVRSVTMGTTMALSRDPIDDYYCYYCREDKMYCQECERSQLRSVYQYKRADTFGSHYADYYSSYYGNKLSWHFVENFFQKK